MKGPPGQEKTPRKIKEEITIVALFFIKFINLVVLRVCTYRKTE